MIDAVNEFANILQIMLGTVGLVVGYATLRSSSTERMQKNILAHLEQAEYENRKLIQKQIEIMDKLSRMELRTIPEPTNVSIESLLGDKKVGHDPK